MKQYSLILLILLSLTANAVAGFTVPQFTAHDTDTQHTMMESHSVGSHHSNTPESKAVDNHGCHHDSECSESEECCVELCHIAYAILLEQTHGGCSKLQKVDNEYASSSTYLSYSIPYFPD